MQAELVGRGARVRFVACDVADRDALAQALALAETPVTGVVHVAGIVEDATITSLDNGRLDRVLAPKVDAAWHLHELTAGTDLAMFTLYSSVAATFGSPGQGNLCGGERVP